MDNMDSINAIEKCKFNLCARLKNLCFIKLTLILLVSSLLYSVMSIYSFTYYNNNNRKLIGEIEETVLSESVLSSDDGEDIGRRNKGSRAQIRQLTMDDSENKKVKYLWADVHIQKHQNDRILEQREWITHLSKDELLMEKTQVRKILVYTKQSPEPDAVPKTYFGAPLKSKMCPLNLMEKCEFELVTCDENRIVPNVSYGAIVTTVNCIESWEKRRFANVPPSTLQFYQSNESPISPFVPSVNLNFGNKILISYWSNADISLPYGKWIADSPKKSNSINTPSSKQRVVENYAQGKSKLVAMLVSNCGPRNGRMKYAKALQEFVQVDIYGKCGKIRCSNNFQECLATLKQYKFYLAFENANCRDYITEKLFRNTFENDVVPIVMGAHPDDYEAIAPKNSYIHIENFKSPEDLANYLNVLDKNDTLYNEYFQWKGTGKFLNTVEDLFCRICAMTIYSEFQPKPSWPENSTLKSVNECLPDSKWYWTKSD